MRAKAFTIGEMTEANADVCSCANADCAQEQWGMNGLGEDEQREPQ